MPKWLESFARHKMPKHGIGIAWIYAVSHEVLFTYLRPIITDFEVASGELWMYSIS